MKSVGRVALVLSGLVLASLAFAEISVQVNFNRVADPDMRDGSTTGNGPRNTGLNNPETHIATPMVTLGGLSHYRDDWEVMTAWNTMSTNGPGWELFEIGGTGTLTFDQIPPLPPGEYHVYLSFNIANWNNGSPIGLQFGGTGVTELGNENPGEMHFFYPPTSTGQDTINNMEVAGPSLGPGSAYFVFGPDGNLPQGSPVSLDPPVGALLCGEPPFFEDCPPMPTGSDPNGFNDTNSFPTAILLDPGNEFVLSIHDGTFHPSYSHIRAYSMLFLNVALMTPETSIAAIEATRLSFDTIDGFEYALQCTTDPTDSGGWTATGARITGTGSNMYLFDPTAGSGDTKVYRALKLE
jgi:hypothetical protein